MDTETILTCGKLQKLFSNYFTTLTYFLARRIREKIGSLRGNSGPILVTNPHAKQVSRSERLIHLVNKFEMRVAKPELVDKAHKRDLSQSGAH